MANRTTDCIPPAIDEFPPDGFTKGQRQQGWIFVHIFLSWYIFISLTILCDEYFVPSLERISRFFNISPDVAGATLMSMATSSPEFFVNMIGTFITQGDIGIGTIVGSAVFNILGVSAACGIFTGTTIPLDWWPLTRDCCIYLLTVLLLIYILSDSIIYWYEASYLCGFYFCYLLLMYVNRSLSKCAQESELSGKIPCFRTNVIDTEYIGSFNENENTLPHLLEFPSEESCFKKIVWGLKWPLYLLFLLTVPDCRVTKRANCFAVTFTMCCIWIAVLTYVVSWCLTIIGDTFQIPDSVMGITILAVGTSIPEVISSMSVAKRGHGSMAICNAIGSNTYDILICLGVPWLIKATWFPSMPGEHSVIIYSEGMKYSSVTLLLTAVLLYLAFCMSYFILGKLVGFMCLILYCIFLMFTILVEMNILFVANKPPCPL